MCHRGVYEELAQICQHCLSAEATIASSELVDLLDTLQVMLFCFHPDSHLVLVGGARTWLNLHLQPARLARDPNESIPDQLL